MYCKYCHRVSTSMYDINLKEIHKDDYKRRRNHAGDNQWRNEEDDAVLLCANCRELLASNSPINVKKVHFAHIFWLLNSTSADSDTSDFHVVAQMLPWTFRYAWFHRHSALSPNAWKYLFCSTLHLPQFRDFTLDRNYLNFYWDEEHIRAKYIINASAAYRIQSVICPMGCTCFVEDENIQFIPIHHYLASCLSLYARRPKGNPHYFAGSRQEWPCHKIFIGHKLSPGIYAHQKLGLCIMACSKKLHGIQNKRFIHNSESLLNDLGSHDVEAHAPAVFSANICALQKTTGSYNTTDRRLFFKGDSHGAAIFRLSENAPDIGMNLGSNSFGPPMGLVYEGSPHFKAYHQHQGKIPEHFDMYKSYTMRRLNDLYTKKISLQDCLKTMSRQATYVPLREAHAITTALALEHAANENDFETQENTEDIEEEAEHEHGVYNSNSLFLFLFFSIQ